MNFLTKFPILPGFLFCLGLYVAVLPMGSTRSSLFDFFTPESKPETETIDLEGFSHIPVLRGGRVKPLDSVARNTLLVLRNKRTALDESGTKMMINLFKKIKSNSPILLIEHDMDAVFALADRVSVINYGKIVATGTVDEIRRNELVRDVYLGYEI